MQYEIIQRPSYSALRCVLNKDEEIHAESGAMLAMDATAHITGTMKGGLFQALKRTVLTSESFFVTTITAQSNESEVYLAPRATGDLESIELKGDEYIVQGGSFLAAEPGIETDAKFTGWKGFVSGEGIFMIKARGTGTMFVSSFGGIVHKQIKKGERFIVDNGHIVAFPSSMTYEIRRVGKGIADMVTTGEGLSVEFEGPGTILMQTRNLRTFAETLNPFLRAPHRSQGSGFLGQIFGG
jgi:uncharacterized protein (TIGR00266 family)